MRRVVFHNGERFEAGKDTTQSYMLMAQREFQETYRPAVLSFWYSVVHKFRRMGVIVRDGMIQPIGAVHSV